MIADYALRALGAGISPLPVIAKDRRPLIQNWTLLACELPTAQEVVAWFERGGFELGVVCRRGRRQDQREHQMVMVDVDVKAVHDQDEIRRLDDEIGSNLSAVGLRGILGACPKERTASGGRHYYIDVALPPETQPPTILEKLGADGVLRRTYTPGFADTPRNEKWTIVEGGGAYVETRGFGGCARIWPTLGFRWLSGEGWIDEIPSLSWEQFQTMRDAFRAASPYTLPERNREAKTRAWPPPGMGDTPSRRYNSRVAVADLLERYGWSYAGSISGKDRWCKPGGSPGESHGSLLTAEDGTDLLHCFSTAASPLEAERNYSAFGLRAAYEFDGDWAACARATLVEEAESQHGRSEWIA